MLGPDFFQQTPRMRTPLHRLADSVLPKLFLLGNKILQPENIRDMGRNPPSLFKSEEINHKSQCLRFIVVSACSAGFFCGMLVSAKTSDYHVYSEWRKKSKIIRVGSLRTDAWIYVNVKSELRAINT